MNDPDFNFAEYYAKGENIYYVSVNDWIGTKELVELKIRTIYPRTIIGYEDNAGCHVIGYNNKDRIFRDKGEAQQYVKTIKVEALYG